MDRNDYSVRLESAPHTTITVNCHTAMIYRALYMCVSLNRLVVVCIIRIV
jgi:hypothetical protein